MRQMKPLLLPLIATLGLMPLPLLAETSAKAQPYLAQAQTMNTRATFIWGGSSSWTCRSCGQDGKDP